MMTAIKKNHSGFTLIELMIVVVVVAVLAAIAVPSYQGSVLKTNRGVGKTELLTLIARQEQYFVNNKNYATDLTDLGYPANPYFIDNNGTSLAATAGSIYQISLASPTTSSFTAQATPQNGQTDDTSCGTLSITHRGVETATGSGDCW